MKDSDGNNFASDLTIAKFLCALAACTEAFSSFAWLLKKHLNFEKFTIHGLNLLQLAAMHGCYITVKACFIYAWTFTIEDLCTDRMHACHYAIQSDFQYVSEFLVEKLGNRCDPDEQEHTTAYYALSSPFPKLIAWAKARLEEQKIQDVVEIMQSGISARGLYLLLYGSSIGFSHSILQAGLDLGRIDILPMYFECFDFADGSEKEDIRVIEIFKHYARHVEEWKRPMALVNAWYLKGFIRRLKTASYFRAARLIQSCFRCYCVLKQYKHYLGVNLSKWLSFQSVWRSVVCEVSSSRMTPPAHRWSVLRQIHDIVAVNNDELVGITARAMDCACCEPEELELEERERDDLMPPETQSYDGISDDHYSPQPSTDNIELSQSVLKWLSGTHPQFRVLFRQRMVQLSEGQRSYALSKRLKHCSYPMYETKLDKGMRILWTKVQRDTQDSLMVWFVSKHDDVNHFVKLINLSCTRMSVLPMVSTESDVALVLSENDVMIDPVGNCPLKLYRTRGQEVSVDANWKPPLRLSGKQRQVNDESGTVLLLGRSGTGKTLCLCDRMTSDARRGGKQLFVCRSKRLCEFARAYQQQYADAASIVNMHFMTLASFTSQMNIYVKMDHGASKTQFAAVNKVDFRRFLMKVFPSIAMKCTVCASVVWLQIRSFIKGSIEAAIQGGPLTIEQYLDLSVFGLDRCRLLVVDRKKVFALYLRYEDVLKTQCLWDDADYTLDLLIRSKVEPLSTQYDKVYVDEVQDNTQAEIVLYFLAAGMNTQSLFLAGDPAQSVVEGVDFRFEDVRSIVYKLSGGKYSINRPMKLFVNYRSHSGILNCAAAVLDKMFVMFPGAANVLPKDVGLFKGPRPACCQVDGMAGLIKLLVKNERLVVMCVDEDVERVESELTRMNIKNTVLGIRAAKGLEFTDVVLLNFFLSVPKADHSLWKSLFTIENGAASTSHPHIELQLKLLYTAVTRSCNRLLFVETERTQLSSVMFRWLVGAGLAEMHNAADESTVLMTSDEWRVQGIEFALSAEGDQTALFLQKAVKCFESAGDIILTDRVTAELQLINARKILTSEFSGCLSRELQLQVATTVMNGLRVGLHSEVKDVCELTLGRVEYGEIFGYEVVKRVNELV